MAYGIAWSVVGGTGLGLLASAVGGLLTAVCGDATRRLSAAVVVAAYVLSERRGPSSGGPPRRDRSQSGPGELGITVQWRSLGCRPRVWLDNKAAGAGVPVGVYRSHGFTWPRRARGRNIICLHARRDDQFRAGGRLTSDSRGAVRRYTRAKAGRTCWHASGRQRRTRGRAVIDLGVGTEAPSGAEGTAT